MLRTKQFALAYAEIEIRLVRRVVRVEIAFCYMAAPLLKLSGPCLCCLKGVMSYSKMLYRHAKKFVLFITSQCNYLHSIA
jgi:hypothetical protein